MSLSRARGRLGRSGTGAEAGMYASAPRRCDLGPRRGPGGGRSRARGRAPGAPGVSGARSWRVLAPRSECRCLPGRGRRTALAHGGTRPRPGERRGGPASAAGADPSSRRGGAATRDAAGCSRKHNSLHDAKYASCSGPAAILIVGRGTGLAVRLGPARAGPSVSPAASAVSSWPAMHERAGGGEGDARHEDRDRRSSRERGVGPRLGGVQPVAGVLARPGPGGVGQAGVPRGSRTARRMAAARPWRRRPTRALHPAACPHAPRRPDTGRGRPDPG